MSRSVRSSLAESIHSVADSMGDEEFLPASPFNPRNLELRRAQQEVRTNKTAFQPQFCRIDSMAYHGRGIVEDNDCVAPVDFIPPPRRRSQPSHTTTAVRSNATNRTGRPPLPSRPIVSDDNAVVSATRHNTSATKTHAPPSLTTSLHTPAPPPPSLVPPSPSRNGVHHRRCSLPSTGDQETTPGSSSATSAGTPHSNLTTAAAATTPRKTYTPMSKLAVAPLSPVCNSPDTFDLSSVGNPHAVRPPLPPRAPTTSNVTFSPSHSRRNSGTHVQRIAERADADADTAHVSGNAVCHAPLQTERRRKMDLADFTAPLSPARTFALEGSGAPPTTSLSGVGTANSSSSQSSVPTLPVLSVQGSSNDTSSPRGVQRRNSSPARVRRTAAAAIPANLGITPANRSGAASSPPASASNISPANGSSNDFNNSLLGGTRVKGSDSSNSTKNEVPPSPLSTGRSSDTCGTPTSHRAVKPLTGGVRAPTDLQKIKLSPSQASAEQSVVGVMSRSSSSSSPSAPSSSSTPVATPSAALRLMADKTPNGRLTAAARITVTPGSPPENVVYHQPPPPPPPPKWKTIVSTPVPVRTTNTMDLKGRLPRSDGVNNTCSEGRNANRGAPSNPDAANANSLNKARSASHPRSLLDAGATSMSDSVRRQYYCLPSTEDRSIPVFARRAGDLHVKTNSLLATGSLSEQRSSDLNDDADSMLLSATLPPSPETKPSARVPSSASPITSKTSSKSPQRQRENSSSAVPQDYFMDGVLSTTGESSHTPGRSPQSDRFVLTEPFNTKSDDTEDRNAQMEPLMRDAVRAFNNRFRQTHLQR